MHKFLRLGLCSVNLNRLKNIRYSFVAFQTRRCSTLETLSFEDIIATRRQQANRSIVVQVNSEKSFPELFKYCQKFGEIEDCHHYKLSTEELHYILVEFQTESGAATLIDSACYNEDLSSVQIRSPFLWFRAGKKKPVTSVKAADSSSKALKIVDGLRNVSDTELEEMLISAENLEEQIQILYRATCLNDIGTRLRFLAARQVESTIIGMFPNANAVPFGSSVNGFGKIGCDLDLILRFDKDRSAVNGRTNDSRLVFHAKESLASGRSQTQRQMECVGDLLHLFLPGVCHVRRILQARVPIIKFHHDHLDLEVDLSMSNLTGVYMSELLYMFGQIDDRVRPLTFCLRQWAQTSGLTNPSPGRWMTNFSLTCLVIYFLQQVKQPILPAISQFTKAAKSDDVRITEDGINCSFARDLRAIQFSTKNQSTLSELLLQFFEFYSQFDFNNRAISLNESRSIPKPDHSALYIVNPLEQHLNVSKNISLEECERFRIEVRNAAWILESELERNPADQQAGKEHGAACWGLLNLFRTSDKAIIRPNMFFKPRMVDVSELFESDPKNEKKGIKYKNSMVRNQVREIRTQMKMNLKQMQATTTFEGKAGGSKTR